jgi:hypothetical protein
VRLARQTGCQGCEPEFELFLAGYSRKLIQKPAGDREVFWRQAGELSAPSRGIRLRLAPRTRQLPCHEPSGVREHRVDRVYPHNRSDSGPTKRGQQYFDAAENARPDHGSGEEDHRQAGVLEQGPAQGSAPAHQ